MINNLIQYLQDKKILILGFGREGKSTYNLIRKYLKDQHLYIADKKEGFEQDFTPLLEDHNVTCISGEKYLEHLQDYDIIMKTPGISFAHIDTTSYRHKIKSQLELLLEFFNVFTIGITGTKGKSTTSSLIHKILTDQNVDNLLLGNIGVPIFDHLDDVNENTILVLEMSSHQLNFLDRSPNIAILLNIYEEHLDHYESFEKYALAKCNIFKYQTKSDYFLYSADDVVTNQIVGQPNAITYRISFNGKSDSAVYKKGKEIYFNDSPIYNENEPRSLLGDYNLNNIMFALTVSEILKLDQTKTRKSISEFKTLPHRLEFVGKYNDVLFYDNSISTVPMATIEAIKALKHVDTLIIGGMDREIDYTDFITYLNGGSVRNIICMPKTGHDIAKKLSQATKYIVEDLEEAVKVAKDVTEKGGICLLSPTAASYGFFKNFEEKGDLYKKLVQS